jgi:hypothetical protein
MRPRKHTHTDAYKVSVVATTVLDQPLSGSKTVKKPSLKHTTRFLLDAQYCSPRLLIALRVLALTILYTTMLFPARAPRELRDQGLCRPVVV